MVALHQLVKGANFGTKFRAAAGFPARQLAGYCGAQAPSSCAALHLRSIEGW